MVLREGYGADPVAPYPGIAEIECWIYQRPRAVGYETRQMFRQEDVGSQREVIAVLFRGAYGYDGGGTHLQLFLHHGPGHILDDKCHR